MKTGIQGTQYLILQNSLWSHVCKYLIILASLPNLHLTANSVAIFERLCPAFKQVVFQGLVLRNVVGR
jgi:hypothetical protein